MPKDNVSPEDGRAITPTPQFHAGLVRLLTLLFILFTHIAAQACGACVNAAAEYSVPGALLGSPLVLVWFGIVASQLNKLAPDTEWVPKPLMTAAIILILIVAGLACLGPFVALPPLLFCIGWGAASFRSGFAEKHGAGFTRKLRRTSVVCAAVFLAFVISSTCIRLFRTEASYIMTWEKTGAGRMELQRLLQSEPASLPNLRQLVIEGNASLATAAAKRLATVGEPQTDVPILIEALERFRFEPDGASSAADLEAALRSLSGSNLPAESTVDQWRQEWQRQPANTNGQSGRTLPPQ